MISPFGKKGKLAKQDDTRQKGPDNAKFQQRSDNRGNILAVGHWESLAADCNGWRHAVNSGVKIGERMRILQLKEKKEQRKARHQNLLEFVRNHCGRLPHQNRTAKSHETLLCTCAAGLI